MARILVADDSETILLLVRTRLEMEGHEVIGAADGEETVAAARAGEPDILLLDAMMPRKSGLDALRELRAEGFRVPALIVSAHTDAGDDTGERADLDIAGYVTKPIDFDDLFARIDALTSP